MKKFLSLTFAIIMAVSFCSQALPFSVNASAGYDVSSNPPVLPAIREWNGDADGKSFVINGETKLIDASGSNSVSKIAGFFKEQCGVTVAVSNEKSGDNEIVFEISDGLPEIIGDEGYTLSVDEHSATVKANTDIGLLYGGITLVQMYFSEGFIRCGEALDYPQYPVRAGMIDVGRTWIPLDYVEEITKYMAWFKLNQIHLHINDCNGTENMAFRLESDIPGLSTVKNGEKLYYTKDEYRDYQKRMLEYGVTVVTEIDTPQHAAVFSQVTENAPAFLPGSGTMLDITDEHRDETLAFVEKLFDEYITGDDPVFVNKTVHIGTDEYDRTYSEEMRKYTAALAEYVYSKGYTPRFWAGLGADGFKGTTPIPQYLQANMWDNGISGLEELVAGGYDIINTLNSVLYVVPTGNGFPDYLDLEYTYNTWQAYSFSGWGINKSVSADYEHLLGACFALWNDLAYLNMGITKYDIFDRIRGMTAIVSEKTWCGGDTANISYEDFKIRYDKLTFTTGAADPGRHSLTSDPFTGYIAYVDGFNTDDTSIFEMHGNAVDGKFILNGNSYLSSSVASRGFPGMLSATLKLDEIPESPLFESEDAAIYADVDGKGHVGFKIDHYTFYYNYSIPVGEEITLTFTCDGKKTALIVNGSDVLSMHDGFGYDPINPLNPSETRLSNLIIPLSSIGKGAKGYIKSIMLSSVPLDVSVLIANRDLALNRPVSVSGLEVNDGRFTASLAVDGDANTRLSFARDKDEQWLIVDLGDEYGLTSVVIDFYERVESYDIFVSTDGEEYVSVYESRGGETNVTVTDTITFSTPAQARYVKYVQNKRNYFPAWDAYYSGGIIDFHVYAYDRSVYSSLVNEAYDIIIDLGRSNDLSSQLRSKANELENYLGSDSIYSNNLNALADDLSSLISAAHGGAASSVPDTDSENEISEPSGGEDSSGVWVTVVIIAAVLAVACIAAILVIRRKKR